MVLENNNQNDLIYIKANFNNKCLINNNKNPKF